MRGEVVDFRDGTAVVLTEVVEEESERVEYISFFN